MKLADVMSSMGLSAYAEVGLVIFFFAFVLVTIQLSQQKNRAEFERARRLPLEDETTPHDEEGR